MNAQRRKDIQNAAQAIRETLSNLRSQVSEFEALGEAEQEAFDNLPEGLQVSERGEAIQEKADALADLFQTLDGFVDDMESELDEQVDTITE